MLELRNITKDYATGESKVTALKGISLFFGKNEFVSILGPSGCGKTTLLNIVGGLDRYTSGQLLINGKSTEEFRAADWDAYRNRCIGFVFQTYNLIPHLTVLGNVELALTLSGVSPSERRERAEKALVKVGLGKELKKLPNQLSGGQMQRVAIARALVNDPDIILADEPTGALDSKTSVQIMELLREIAADKLIIMVTHNKSLAEEYSSRIITLLDGEVVSDTAPAPAAAPADGQKQDMGSEKAVMKKTSMSFFTALSISLRNLFTKKGRTFMTSLAASIGIVGIALVLAISNGFSRYIDKLQSDTLANYPVTVSTTTMNMEAMMNEYQNIGSLEMQYKGEDKAAVYDPSGALFNMMDANIITEEYVDYVNKMDSVMLNGQPVYNDIQYSYQTQMVFMNSKKNVISDYTFSMMEMMGMVTNSTMQEVMSNEEFIRSQYEVVYGSYPSAPEDGVHKVAIVVDKYNRLSVSTLNKLGIEYVEKTVGFEPIDYSDLIGREFKVLSPDVYYVKNSGDDVSFRTIDKSEYDAAYDDARNITMRIVGVMRVKETTPIALYTSGILYLPSLTQSYLELCKQSEIGRVQAQDEDYCYVPGTYDGTYRQKVSIDVIQKPANNTYGSELTRDEAIEYVRQIVGISDIPNKIYIYPKSFECKSLITEYLDKWNDMQEDKDESEKRIVKYTDASAIFSSTLGQMIDIISYVLIAFACVSLIVSSIMIGIITYASVIERTKEIGVLRSIGARKKDIARVFNAETVLIGFVAGMIGILLSYLLCVPINAIIHSLAGDMVTGSLAVLNPLHALILVVISVCLTLVGGFIPAMIAAKKDPVVALRTE